MIVTRTKSRFRTVTYTTTRPRALIVPMRKRNDASNDYESALMDGDFKTAARIRHATMVAWLRKVGSYNAARIPRPV